MTLYHCKWDKFTTRSFPKLAKHCRTKHAAEMKAARSRGAKARRTRTTSRAPKTSRRAVFVRSVRDDTLGDAIRQVQQAGGYVQF